MRACSPERLCRLATTGTRDARLSTRRHRAAGRRRPRVDGRVALPLDPHFEHALVVLSGSVTAAATKVLPDTLAYVGPGPRELVVDAPRADPGALARRRALRRGDRDVVELRRADE